jgi:hypothetical protein
MILILDFLIITSRMPSPWPWPWAGSKLDVLHGISEFGHLIGLDPIRHSPLHPHAPDIKHGARRFSFNSHRLASVMGANKNEQNAKTREK